MVDVNCCPACTEFVHTPRPISRRDSDGSQKYKCPRCGIEFKYLVTKEPDYKNWNNTSEDVLLGRR